MDKIATTFNLDRAEVQKVFDQDRDERKTEIETKFNNRITEAVNNGELTQDQADKIKAKRTELKTFMDSQKDKTKQERHEAMRTKRAELQQWAKDNNIPDKFNHFMYGPKIGKPQDDIKNN